MPSIRHPDAVWHGWDVHKDTISVAVLHPGKEIPATDKIFHDEPSVRRLIDRSGDRSLLRVCYEAGPTGYELARLLASMGVHCDVIAPSLIPTAPGDRVKTDSVTAADWSACSAPASWSPSACPHQKRRRCGTCAAPALTWSPTGAAPANGWAASCYATPVSTGPAKRGRTPTPPGWGPKRSTSPP